jgi:1-acyl-sn-glycerol-3-phosphate acyltransferase
MLPAWPHNGVTFAKKALQYYGFFGISASLSGAMFVDRFDTKDALKTMETAVKKIKTQKVCPAGRMCEVVCCA